MTINLYSNGSVPNKVNKSLSLVYTVTGTLRAGTSILSPTFLLTGTPANLAYNYFQVVEWQRYYFLGPVEFNIQITITITGAIDVLMSFSEDIYRTRAILDRQENLWNMYLNDGALITNQNNKHKIIAFPNSFDNFSYVLALAGNGQTSE